MPFCLEVTFYFLFYLLTFEREREREVNLLFHLFMHLLLVSCMCPGWGLNPQPWRIGMMLQPMKLSSQGIEITFYLMENPEESKIMIC